METDCIIALIAGIMVLVSGSVIGFYSWDKAYGGRNVITGIGVMVLGAVLIAGSFSANNSAKERKARESEVRACVTLLPRRSNRLPGVPDAVASLTRDT